MDKIYDVIIIGAGPAGLTAAIYARRASKTVLLIEAKSFGGQIINTPHIDNYPASPHISATISHLRFTDRRRNSERR